MTQILLTSQREMTSQELHELAQILEQKGLPVDIQILQDYIVNNHQSTQNTQKPQTTWHTSTAPLREPTTDEQQAIEEFLANPNIATEEEVSETEQELGITLNFD
jgi:aconitase A